MRNCLDESTLQAWSDRELAPNAAVEVAAHLKACVGCAEAMRAIDAENSILSAALSAEFAETIPTERLRERVEAAVAGLQVVKVPSAPPSRWHSLQLFFASFRSVAYVSMAAAILLATFLAVVYLKKENATPLTAHENRGALVPAAPQASPEQTVIPVASRPSKTLVPRATKPIKRDQGPETPATSLSWQEQQYERAIVKLNEAIRSQPPLRPSLLVEYEYNLALINSAIATTRDVARKTPSDPQAAQFMLSAYQSKVDLMNQIANVGVLER
jgi:anti-sigma factor RsiW